MWISSLGWEDVLEEEMATCSKYSCLENSVDRGAWWVTVHGVAKSQARLNDSTPYLYSKIEKYLTSRTYTDSPSNKSQNVCEDLICEGLESHAASPCPPVLFIPDIHSSLKEPKGY